VARKAPALVVVSQPLLESLVALGVEERRISIMPMAVDVTHFRPDREAGDAIRRKWHLDGRFVVGYVGSLSGWPGISLLYEMARQLRAKRADVAILVVGGEGDQLARHREQVVQAGLENHLVFAGSVPYGEVPAHINAMDVTLVPDTNYWTCPTKMFEYQASAVPTVAPKYPAIVKAIDHGEEGLLFEPRNIAEAAGYILRLADDPELRRAMGEKSRRRVVSTQSWQHNVGRIVSVFERIKSGELSIKP
jgi:glycosyltransferase involved in cell wall biosynthesis